MSAAFSGWHNLSSEIATESEGFLELFRFVFRRRYEERASSVIASHHPVLDIKPVDNVGLREGDGLSQFQSEPRAAYY